MTKCSRAKKARWRRRDAQFIESLFGANVAGNSTIKALL